MGLAALLFPLRCVRCGADAAELPLCPPCAAELPHLESACPRCAEPLPRTGVCGRCLAEPPPFVRVLAPFLLAAPVADWILGLKEGGQLHLGALLGGLLARHVDRCGTAVDALVPVPLHWRRRLRRGFNQSLEIARSAGRHLDVPVRPRWLARVRPGPDQRRLPLAQRAASVHRAFRASDRVAGLRIALVDDVVTTTATARAATAALLAAGAAAVEVWAVARTALENGPSAGNNGLFARRAPWPNPVSPTSGKS
ncbi:MAG: phosphoribosyltransferase [Porticoccaceae bacterium]|nr:MAG: phosphoribosyltransferase [Porticoccaceae bacterium]